MPLPVKINPGDDVLRIDDNFCVAISGYSNTRIERAAIRLTGRVAQITQYSNQRSLIAKEDATLLIQIEKQTGEVQQAEEDESYNLEVNKSQAVLRSPTFYGVLRGFETFIQCIQPDDVGFIVPTCTIHDHPRFPWRGLLIDTARHWIPADAIKRNLDAMASVKLNVLHWHLTNDQGFRIESKRYPLLHEEGSDGQFYTQEEVRGIVEFATDRGIRVLPEFDMPGHTSSWFVGYPELASAPGPYKIERKWGGYDAIMDPVKESTYIFIQNFLSEMTTLFPDSYVHIGGDEVKGLHWLSNKHIKKFIQENNKDVHQLHTYFNLRLQEILSALDKKMIGWDPIFNSDLPKSIAIQSVRGQKWLVQAVKEGFNAVAGSEYYLDLLKPAAVHYLSDPYSNEVSELSTEQKGAILGGEASVWTEFVTQENIDSRIWPRAAAIAERLWSPSEIRDVEDMYRRLEDTSGRLTILGLKNESGPQQMLDRLSNSGSIKSLIVLAETLHPTFDIRWENSNYNSLMAMNRIVDAIAPENILAYEFAQLVKKFIDKPSDKILLEQIDTKLKKWNNNHQKFKQDIVGVPSLEELEPLSKMLFQITEIGLKTIKALSKGQSMSLKEHNKNKEILLKAAQPFAEVDISINQSINNLLEAVQISA